MCFDTQSPSTRTKFIRIADGRDEFNLAEFPLTLLSDKVPSGCKTIKWQDEITGSDRFGLR